MFSNLRQGSQIYVFHKCASTPFIEMGSVEMQNPFGSIYPTMPTMPINFSIRIGDKVIPAPNLPPNAEVADVTNSQTGETITLACSKDAINAELQTEKQKSIDSINSVDYHRQRIVTLDAIHAQLNPEVAEKAQQAQEISNLKAQMSNMANNMEELMKANRELMEQLKGERASSTKKKE